MLTPSCVRRLALGLLSILAISATAFGGTTTIVSIDSSNVIGNARSGISDDSVAISGDGRFVAFDSDATNLVAGDTNGRSDVFLRDRQSGTTVLVSVTSGGVQGNGNSARAAISSDGRYVVFRSSATNLVAGDTNAVDDIFVRDTQAATTVRVSQSSAGVQGNAASSTSSISTDGRFIAFASQASTLITGDTNGVRDVFLVDRDADADGIFDEPGATTTSRVSVGAGGAEANAQSRAPALSSDGRYVVFDSDATNLVAGDTNAVSDVFIFDRVSSATTRVSVDSSGVQSNGASSEPVISGNGRFVMYQSDATNLVAGDTNGVTDIFVHDRNVAVTARISVSSGGAQANGPSTDAAISPGARFTAFRSTATNLVTGDTNGRADAFVYDRQTATTSRVSVDSNGIQGNDDSGDPSVSNNGQVAVFSSVATNIVTGDSNAVSDVFVHDLVDVSPPVIQCPSAVTAECSQPGGGTVTFSVTAFDGCDPNPTVVCVPASGSVFSFGTTTVNCTATDVSNNVATCSFGVTMADTTAPTLACPSGVTAECTRPSGADVSFSVTATDVCDGAPSVFCAPSSGSAFAMGQSTVSCTSTDAAGNVSTCSFDVNVVDTTAPSVSCSSNLTVECEGPAGAVASFGASATDVCDLAPSVGCVPASGSTFPLGTTSIVCSSQDAAGNVGSCSFSVHVFDTVAPAIQCPSPSSVECATPSGTAVKFAATASDLCDVAPAIACVPASGSVFPLGTTSVSCTATDVSGNASGCSFDVTIVDTTAPAIQCPTDVTANCQQSGGAIITFDATATDACDSAPVVECVPGSGTLFPIGLTQVDCTATDGSGNSSSCSFNVTVGNVTLTSVLPNTGTVLGGDLTNIFGCGFTTAGDTTVRVGGVSASIVDVTSSHIRFRTPAGSGTADVEVTNSNGTAVLPAAYTYVDATLAARFGNVNVARGDRENVLTVNGSTGNAFREVSAPLLSPISAAMATPSSRVTARFAVYAWARFPNGGTMSVQPSGLGIMCLPTPLNHRTPPQPNTIWNNIGFPFVIGQPTFPSSPAPTTFFNFSRGFGVSHVITFQGFIQDDGSQIPQGYSITNAVILHVGP
ncbi:MAG: HYR domain-containing protein [Planctomycetes bacterium]|nr:HYR domain-containing protein [Planctomycetota bacterium]MBI3844198.1 HYR domain-containing protein [Planctomycetota bacterium]